MIHLIIVVEGQTEEIFVKDVIKPHLELGGVFASATIVGKIVAHERGHTQRGGGHFKNWRRDIEHILKRNRNPSLRVTTMFDLYGLPDGFPGLEQYGKQSDTSKRCEALEACLAAEFNNDPRLIPYIQRHEFEALVLASLESLYKWLDASDDLAGLAKLHAEISGLAPEDINDDERTAPSKRLTARIPGYSKSLHGPGATSTTGLPQLRSACPRFDAWISKLERLAG